MPGRKRKISATTSSAASTPKQQQRKRNCVSSGPSQPRPRTSARISRKAVEFIGLGSDSGPEPVLPARSKQRKTTSSSGSTDEDEADSRTSGKVFGAIPNVPVGTWWAFRDDCGRSGVHPPTVAGIYGSPQAGAYSVAVSAGYPEDQDRGDTFTYTGSGGRELKAKNLRTAPQSKDQELTRGNASLDNSFLTAKPVRVIRGFKAALGPVSGYRYDGLYRVVRSYTALNKEGRYKVYKFDFERLPGQPAVDYHAKERTLAQQAAEQAAEQAAVEQQLIGEATAAATAAANSLLTPVTSDDETAGTSGDDASASSGN